MNEAGLAAIIVALIGGPLMWALHRFDRRNTSQHSQNMEALSQTRDLVSGIDSKIDRVEQKVDTVDQRLYDHVTGTDHRRVG